MNRIAILLAASMIYGCATQQPQKSFPPPTDYVLIEQISIKSTFDTIVLSKQNLLAEHLKCVPPLSPPYENIIRAVNKFPQDQVISTAGHRSSSKLFIYHGTTGLCLEFSTSQHPILAAETFAGTANPTGIPPNVADDWNKALALKVAISGKAKVAYASDSGNAMIASYWVDPGSSYTLWYSTEFKNAGEWENMPLDHKFIHPSVTGFREIKRGKAEQMVKRFPLAKG